MPSAEACRLPPCEIEAFLAADPGRWHVISLHQDLSTHSFMEGAAIDSRMVTAE